MKTLILAAIRCSLMFTAVAALSLAYPASVQAVPTTYQYTGNPFTNFSGPYTTSDFVSGMVRLAGPLAPNFNGTVTPTAFTFSDGVQTLTNLTTNITFFQFVTGPTGQIVRWDIQVRLMVTLGSIHAIATSNMPPGAVTDGGGFSGLFTSAGGANIRHPGVWVMPSSVADTGSTLLMLSLTLIALGLVARRFKRAAA